MTSAHLTDQKPRVDAVDALRVLVADLRGLADRLELKERGRNLGQTLKAAEERVSGPRAVVMLLGEHEDLKRRFLERLLGPHLTQVPTPTTMCTRLEYGTEPEQLEAAPPEQAASPGAPREAFQNGDTAEAPRPTVRAIRLSNPTLKGGLAVIDTPIVGGGELASSVLECAERADAWIFVLGADHELSEAGQALLRRLPERGARLEMVVEGVEALSGEARMAARERLTRTLHESCNIEAPRLTLIASAATEGEEGNFWHGRFATFHSVMMLRGRERWMDTTRAVIAGALSEVGAEIDFELNSIEPGLRHSRLRLGMKDLDGLRTRFNALGRPDSEHSRETKPDESDPSETMPQQSRLGDVWSGRSEPVAADGVASALSPMAMLTEAIAAAAASESPAAQDAPAAEVVLLPSSSIAAPRTTATASTAAAGAAEPPPISEPVFVSFARPVRDIRSKRGVSVKFSESLARLIRNGNAAEHGKRALAKRVAIAALVIAFIWLIVWALSPRGFLFGSEPASEWNYHQPKPAAAHPAVLGVKTGTIPDLPQAADAGSLPDTAGIETPGIPRTLSVKPSAAIRTPLLRPIPSGATAGVPPHAKRHHRHLLGLGKLWYWVRHGRGKSAENSQ